MQEETQQPTTDPAPAPATDPAPATNWTPEPDAVLEAQRQQSQGQAEYQEKKAAHIAGLKAKWAAAKGGLHQDLKEFLEALLESHLGAFQD